MINDAYTAVVEFVPNVNYFTTPSQKVTLKTIKEAMERSVDSKYGSVRVKGIKKKQSPQAKPFTEADITGVLKSTYGSDGTGKNCERSLWFRCHNWEIFLYKDHNRDTLGTTCYISQDGMDGLESLMNLPVEHAPRTRRECAIFWLAFHRKVYEPNCGVRSAMAKPYVEGAPAHHDFVEAAVKRAWPGGPTGSIGPS